MRASEERASALPSPATARAEKRRRWGLRTLGCLTLAAFSIIVAVLQGHHTPGTLGCVVLGLGGAAYCTFKGLDDLLNLGWYKRLLGSRADRED